MGSAASKEVFGKSKVSVGSKALQFFLENVLSVEMSHQGFEVRVFRKTVEFDIVGLYRQFGL